MFSTVLQSFRKDEHSRKNRITLENAAFYQLMPENSDSLGRTLESCRAYQMQEIRTYSSLWEMCSDFFFLMALFLVEMHSAAALCSKNQMDAKCVTCTYNYLQIANNIVDSGMLGFGKTLFVEDFSQFINDDDNTAVGIMDISVIHRDKQLVLSAAELTCFRRRSLPRCRFDASRRMRDSASLS